MKVRKDSWEGLASAIRARRNELGETAASVASRCGMSRSYFSQIERGEIQNPTLETTDRVLRALGLDLILGRTHAQGKSAVLAYESPFTLRKDSEEGGRMETMSATTLLQRTLKDARIPLAQRKLLEGQIAALVWVVRKQFDAKLPER